MADETPPTEPTEPPLMGLAGYLDEDVEWSRLMTRVHRSIARREVSGQAVELVTTGFTGVILEYLRALFAAFSGEGRRRAD